MHSAIDSNSSSSKGRRSRRLNTLQIKQLQDGEDIYNALTNASDPIAFQVCECTLHLCLDVACTCFYTVPCHAHSYLNIISVSEILKCSFCNNATVQCPYTRCVHVLNFCRLLSQCVVCVYIFKYILQPSLLTHTPSQPFLLTHTHIRYPGDVNSYTVGLAGELSSVFALSETR